MKFHNQHKTKMFGKYTDPYGERRVDGELHPKKPLPHVKPDFKRMYDGNKLYFSWLGHSSVFINMDGMNILIDPVFSKHPSPVDFVGPKRFVGGRLRPEHMPEIDIVLITHNHYDHLDKETIRKFDSQVKRYIVPLKVSGNLQKFGVEEHKISELDWYEETVVNGLKIALVPSQHDSSRSMLDMDRSLWGGYILKNDSFTVFDSGDGGFADHFEEIHRRYGDIDLAIMECGQYNVKWHAIHMFPEESAEACRILNAKLSVPVHWGAYVLSDHAWDEPPRRFIRRAKELGVNYKVPKINEIIELG